MVSSEEALVLHASRPWMSRPQGLQNIRGGFRGVHLMNIRNPETCVMSCHHIIIFLSSSVSSERRSSVRVSYLHQSATARSADHHRGVRLLRGRHRVGGRPVTHGGWEGPKAATGPRQSETDLHTLQEKWSLLKQQFCCQHHRVGCVHTTSLPFDCFAGFSHPAGGDVRARSFPAELPGSCVGPVGTGREQR